MTSDQITSIIEAFDHTAEYFVWQGENATLDMDEDDRLEKYYETVIPDVIDDDEDYEKILALMEHTGDTWDECDSNIGDKYTVFTDAEAEKEFVERTDSRMNDVMDEIPTHLRQYFDREAYISDNFDDRGSELSSYDGCENEETINGTTYYIYKQ